ncbi:hypothetical protein VHEMI10405 [[Torrubiella] hemipterigena]|uniref:Fatty acid hydroxylase domain-containing protein n=1 Tax=[Torrubiella] hemipterigena TaxID=1531966 RepID=A0A0A1TS31_9HYPO|nr:hypothetical protein VHEMI10405 [[Torrubiella] hemipterigena]
MIRNSKDSMKSTWRTGDRKSWSWAHWGFELVNAHPKDPNKSIPVFKKSTNIPHLSQRSSQIFIWVYAALPMILHELYTKATGWTLHPLAAFFLYTAGMHTMLLALVHSLRRLVHSYGFFDSEVVPERADIPDVGVAKVALSAFKTLDFRLAIAVLLTYNVADDPIILLTDTNRFLMALVKLGTYSIMLDMWYYTYHRSMHDISWLWKYHRTHHLAKHPTMLMTGYADLEQEIFDIFIVPLLTFATLYFMGLPLSFCEWYTCNMYILYGEIWGHSGIRLHACAPNPFHVILEAMGADLPHEDHDLHHRKGYRSSGNYGKQTRVWDRLFGTSWERIETHRSNVDYANMVIMPLY